MDVYITSEATYTGYLNFEVSTNAFKAYILNVAQVNISNLTYTWTFQDSSGNIVNNSLLETYSNSIGVPT